MAGIGPADAHALAQELLEACVSALDTIPESAPGLGGSPERYFVSPGEPAALAAAECCDKLTVHIAQVTEAPTEPTGQGGLAIGRRASYSRINHVGLIVTVFRCVPTSTNARSGVFDPPAEDLDATAAQIHADVWALWNHIFNLIRAGSLFSTLSF